MTTERPRVLAILPGVIPSTSILIIKPLLRLHDMRMIQALFALESRVRKDHVLSADVVVFCRNTDPRHGGVLDFIEDRGVPRIFDIDDNFFDVPADTDVGRYHREPERLEMLQRYMRSANLVRVYSRAMAAHARSINPNVVELFAPIDLAPIRWEEEKRSGGKTRIAYATSRMQQDRLPELFLPALKRSLEKYGKAMEVHFWGTRPKGMPEGPSVYVHAYTGNYDRFLRKFSRARHDIGLAPLLDDAFHRSKTNNKFREYGACGIAGIYSRVEVYSSCVAHEETGLLTENDPEAWYGALSRLMESPELRERIRINARRYVEREYSEDAFCSIFLRHIKELTAKRKGEPLPEHRDSSESPAGGERKGGRRDVEACRRLTRRGALEKVLRIKTYFSEGRIEEAKALMKQYLLDRWTILKLAVLTSRLRERLRGTEEQGSGGAQTRNQGSAT